MKTAISVNVFIKCFKNSPLFLFVKSLFLPLMGVNYGCNVKNISVRFSCLALNDLIRSCDPKDVIAELPNLWSITFKVMDDIKVGEKYVGFRIF